jgi:type IV secretion system protein VirB10
MSNIDNDTVAPLDADRGIPSVNQRRSGGGKGWVFFIVILAVVILAVIWTALRLKRGAHDALTPSQKTQQEQQAAKGFGGRTFNDALMPAAVPPVAPIQASAPVAPLGMQPMRQPPMQMNQPMQQHQISPREKGYDSALTEDGGSGGGSPFSADNAAHSAAVALAAEKQQTGGAVNANRGPLAGVLTSTQTPASVAGTLENRQFLVAKGTQIDCDLKTALSSDVPGMTSCVVTKNIYSDDGSTVLIERGSEVTGEYQSNMKQGQTRIFVLWNRVKSPEGVVVNLDSPGADALGRSGLDGYVDNHWFERLGAAFMLSIVQDAIGYATARAQSSGNGGTVFFQNSSQTGDNMASKILDSTINIPPTLSKNQGERISIFVARDLDFSKVYAIQ